MDVHLPSLTKVSIYLSIMAVKILANLKTSLHLPFIQTIRYPFPLSLPLLQDCDSMPDVDEFLRKITELFVSL